MIWLNSFSVQSQTIKIGVLFPFQAEQIQTSQTNRPNQFALDFYQGLLLAKDSLQQNGITLEINAYDVDKDTTKLLEVLNDKSFANTQLVLGPIFTPSIPIMGLFAETKSITAFVPFNTSYKAIEKTKNVYLLQASNLTLADQVTEFAIKQFQPDTAIIITSRQPKDTLQAYLTKMYYEAKGGKVIGYSRVDKSNFWALNKSLTDSKLAKSGVVFIFNSDQMVAANIVNVLELYDKNIPVIATNHWLEFQSANFEQLQRRNFHFILPDYSAFDSIQTQRFRRNYSKKFNAQPSVYSSQGFEWAINLLPKVISGNANSFRNIGYIPGVLLPGFDYSQSSDNRFVPIYKFIDNRLRLVNR